MRELFLNEMALMYVNKYYNKEILNPNYLLEEYFKAYSNEYEDLLYPNGIFKKRIEIGIACGPIRVKNDNSIEREVYIIYGKSHETYLICILENNRVVMIYNLMEDTNDSEDSNILIV